MDKQFNQACEICWTNSWVPVPDDDPDAQQLLDGPGSVRCDHCWLKKQYMELEKKIERLLAAEREKVRDALNWALGELSDRGYSENIPKHDCGYTANPEGGYCEFCDMWVKAQECLDLTAPDTDEVSFVCTHCNNAGPLSECLGKQYERITGPRCPRCDYCVQVLRKPKHTAPSSTEEKENG